MLSVFGDLIENISTKFVSIKTSVAVEIVKLLTEKCSKTLKIFELQISKKNLLNEFTEIFPKMTSLSFSADEFEVDPKQKKLHEIFPNVISLEINKTMALNWLLVEGKFSKLTTFIVTLRDFFDMNGIDETHVTKFLKLNPQITEFGIKNTNLKMLLKANEILHNLDSLRIKSVSSKYLNYNGKPIQFKSVKNLFINLFETSDKPINPPEHIFFENLQSFELNISPNFNDKWTELISSQINPNITKIKFTPDVLSNKYLQIIPQKLNNLEFVDIRCISKFIAKDIRSFVENCTHLQKLYMQIEMTRNEKFELEGLLQEKWNITIEETIPEIDRVTIFVER